MRLFLLALLGLWLGTASLQAQSPPAAPAGAGRPSQASLDELVRVLEDDASRRVLIERLKAGPAAPGAAARQGATLPATAEPTFARQLAEYSQTVAEQAAAMLKHLGALFAGLGQVLNRADAADDGVFWGAMLSMALMVGVVIAAFAVLRLLTAPLLAMLDRRAARAGAGLGAVALRVALIPAALVIEVAAVVLAWAGGYFFALSYGQTGAIAVHQTLILNAFLAVEGGKAVVRALLMPRQPALRPLPLGDDGARAWSFWLSRGASIIGYTMMLLAPLLNSFASAAAAQSLRLLAMLLTLLLGILAVLRHRRSGRAWVEARRDRRGLRAMGQAWTALGHVWHLLAILYMVALFLAWVANPREALFFMLRATAQSLAVIAAATLVLHLMRRALARGIAVPETLTERLPLLERRLNTMIPAILKVLRVAVLVAVALGLLWAWKLFDLPRWLSTAGGGRFAGAIVSAGLILLAGMVMHLAMSSWVEYRLNPNYGTVPTPRERTLLALFRNAATIALVVMVAMLALSEIGVNIGPLLAGAGVVGLAIGFGAQKLVQDIITGVFIQLENALNEGDVVAAGGVSGVVERLTIRSLSIRDSSGTLHLIPFSSVTTVANMMKDFGFHVADIAVSYRESIPAVKEALQEAFARLQQTDHGANIIGDLDMQGITSFGESAIMMRVRIKTQAGKHWGAGRAYSEIVKLVFEERGIEMPYPHRTVTWGGEEGKALPPRPAALLPPARPEPAAD
ncbi:mechanosensitive ion channel domain-containing protein [Roseomonas sp. 18066]|uniref:mechanosensitive ion channel domain-containing protein n=1 Tax=Roseomonas sp. 18066 TaxID=2681412 RepID=UPI00135A0DB8|nr:mechanosensitive ion channel domain-containing protein [Roseomonas sp. 18066]